VSVNAADSPPAEWDDFLAAHPAASFFHQPLWTELVCRHVQGSEPVWLAARRQGDLVGGLTAVRRRRGLFARLISHHEGTCGGPLVAPGLAPEEQQRVFATILERYAALVGGRTVALSVSLDTVQEQRFGRLCSAAGWQRTEIPTAVLPLSGGIEHVEKHVFKKNRRNERNRSLKKGCQPGVTDDPAILAEYYPIYLESARRWRIEPAPEGLLRDLLVQGRGAAFLTYVRFEGRVIGAHLSLHRGDRVTAWNGATLAEHNDKFPATLLIWTDLEEACRREAAVLDLGGSAGLTKLASFKKLLGAEEEIRGHYLKEARLFHLARRARGLLPARGGER